MKVSLNIIKQLVDFDLPPVDQLVARINQQLGGVEEVIELGEKYASAVIVRVVSADKHPNADKLTVCRIDDGGVTAEVARDDDGLVQVVCGAPNVEPGMMAVWLPPQSTVPSTWDDDEPFVLSARELRGVMSQGMLAAADELGIGTDHDGIISLTDDDLSPELAGQSLEPGQKLADVFGLHDTIIDIENKMFTHRPDCFGQLGVAREIAGILGHQFVSPDWYRAFPTFASAEGRTLSVEHTTSVAIPRFMTVVMQDIVVKPSPFWLQCALVAMGGKPINNIVDATNYVMLMTAQPTHAYDYDTLRGHVIGGRMARQGETVTLLNGKTYELTDSDIVIVDGEGPIGLAGIMGGAGSEVSAATTTVVLEVACFDMYMVRKSSMRHGLFTDALTRFNKGQSSLQQPYVLAKLMQLVQDLAGGVQASDVSDIPDRDAEIALPQSIMPQFIRDRLGIPITKYDMVQMIGAVEFPLCEDCGWNPEDKEDNDDELHVNVPFWRTDIHLPEDVVEEIGRLHGYDKLPRELPTRTIAPAPTNHARVYTQKIRDSLRAMGANEVLTYSFVHENVMRKSKQDVSQAFQLSNALSPDLQYYRLSVLPSLLDKVHANIRAGYSEFVLYEIGKGHNKKYHYDDDEGLPRELKFLDMVYASKSPRQGAAFYQMRRTLTRMALDFGFTLHFAPVDEALDYPVTAPFDQSRSALVSAMDGTFIGMVGELKQTVRKNFKLPAYTAAATLDLDALITVAGRDRTLYTPLGKFPSMHRDISLRVKSDTSYRAMFDTIRQAVGQFEDMDVAISLTSIYAAENSDEKTFTFHLDIVSKERTLDDDDVAPLISAIAAHASRTLSAHAV